MSYPPPPPPPDGGYGYVAPRTNSKAIWALVLGILAIVPCSLFTAIPAIILATMAKNEVSASGGSQTGAGLAVSGLVLGIIGVVVAVAWIVAATALGTFTLTGR
jgi:hypothetical protein